MKPDPLSGAGSRHSGPSRKAGTAREDLALVVGYENPDADLTLIMVDDVDGVLRMRGAAVTTVQGWTAPGSTDELPEHDRWGGVAYIDDTGQTFTVLSEPRITGAQPELVPGVTSPMEGAPFPLDGPGNCDGLCRMP